MLYQFHRYERNIPGQLLFINIFPAHVFTSSSLIDIYYSQQLHVSATDCGTTGHTGLSEMIVGVLTTCHTQYTWDSSICIFLYNRTTLHVFVTYLTGALYVHPLWFYKHQHDNRMKWDEVKCKCTKRLLTAAILVNCATSGEIHNYCTPHIIKENFENFLIHRWNYILYIYIYTHTHTHTHRVFQEE
jgi:uncharacterized membrane protein